MIMWITNRITGLLVSKNIINEDIEIYEYGLAMLISYSINVFIIMSIGFVNKTVLLSIIYLICFDKLRDNCGGYHAKTYTKCSCSFALIHIIYLIISKYVNFASLFIVAGVLWLSLFTKLPVEHPNKKLTLTENQVNGKKANINFFLYLFFSLVVRDHLYIGNAICTSIILICLLCYVQLYINNKEERLC